MAIITGTVGDDTLHGTTGNDTIDGGAGNDTVTGGAGADTFVFSNGWDTDLITDFNPNEDMLNLSGSGLSFHDLDIITSGDHIYITAGENTLTLVTSTSGFSEFNFIADDFAAFFGPVIEDDSLTPLPTTGARPNVLSASLSFSSDDTISGGQAAFYERDANGAAINVGAGVDLHFADDIWTGGSRGNAGGFYLEAGAEITLSGTVVAVEGHENSYLFGDVFGIFGMGASITNTGTIDLIAARYSYGLTSTADTVEINNSGTVNVFGDNISYGIYLRDSVIDVTNSGTIASKSDGTYGIHATDVSGTITNSGEISLISNIYSTSGYYNSWGIRVSTDSSATIINEGVIDADIGILATGTLTIENSGTITGSIAGIRARAEYVGEVISFTNTGTITAEVSLWSNTEDGNTMINQGTVVGRVSFGDGTDYYDGRGGSVTSFIYGGRGNDTLIAGADADYLRGGNDDDSLIGGAGNDTLDGEGGNDTLFSSSGNGHLWGGDGNDHITVLGGSPDVSGDAGDDTIYIHGDGSPDVYGEGGNDYITTDFNEDLEPATGNYSFHGGAGNDTLHGGDGNDVLVGAEDDDLVYGGKGSDWLIGDTGNDILSGGEGNDLLVGDTGFDTATYIISAAAVSVNLESGIHTGGDAQNDTLVAIESVVGSNHDDTLVGDTGNNDLSGGLGKDTLAGGLGADTMDGGAGQDMLDYTASGAGVMADLSRGRGRGGDAEGDRLSGFEDIAGSVHNDTLIGDAYENRLMGGNGFDFFDGGAGADYIHGGGDQDRVNYGASSTAVHVSLDAERGYTGDAEGDVLIRIEELVGSDYNDTLEGSTGRNKFWGGDGDDLITANDGPDVLYGEAGNDTLDGGEGRDIIIGGTGNDSITGGLGNDIIETGAGNDVLTFSDGHGGDFITDFDITSDTLDLTAITGIASFADLNAEDGRMRREDGVFLHTSSSDFVFIAGVTIGEIETATIVN